jgi:hypothetical protein
MLLLSNQQLLYCYYFLTHTCTVEAVHFTHLFRRIEILLWDCQLCTEGDAHLFAQDSGPGLPFFHKGLNAAA